jgi:G:T-mismatch repair DNA endonuclease (very short patch repair protein)
MEKLKLEIEQKLFNSRNRIDYVYLKKYPEILNRAQEHMTGFDDKITSSQLVLFFYEGILSPPKCQNAHCEKYVKWWSNKKCFSKYCCIKCSNSDPEKDQTTIKNNMEKYGVPRASMTTESKQKLLNTNLCRYGVSSTAQLKEVKDKAKQTCLKKYNYISSSISDIKNLEEYSNRDFIIENFINDNIFDLYGFRNYFNCGQVAAHNTLNRLNIDYNKYAARNTFIERIVEDFLKENNITFIKNDRMVLNGKELDFYLPEHKLGVELNGLYWHSYNTKTKILKSKKDIKNFHRIKTDRCEEQNIQLFHIFENEILYKFEIWKSVLENTLGRSIQLEAEDHTIKPVPKYDIKPFLEANHLQGYCSSSIAYGLYYNNNNTGIPELISIMTFTKGSGSADWELMRFCNKLGYNVYGAASRLLKAFRVGYKGNIKTCVNRRWSNGNLYRQLGFQEIGISEPNKFIINFNKINNLYSRLAFQKYKLPKNSNFDNTLSADENIINNGYGIIWDSGQINFILKGDI